MLTNYQLNIADFQNIHIGIVKKLVPNFFDKDKYVLHYQNSQLHFLLYEDFSKDIGMFDFSNYSAKSKYYNDSNKLAVGKVKDVTAGVVLKNLLNCGIGLKIYSFLVNDSSEHKKPNGVNRNVVATINYNECKDVLLNRKC